MKLDKAIEILTQATKDITPVELEDLHDAERLGIEALKRCKERSDRFPNLPHLRLPGEDSENAPLERAQRLNYE